MSAPVEWEVVQVIRVIDGDSVRIRRSRRVELDGRYWRLIDDAPDGVPLRLLWIDSPERGEVGWGQARADLTEWIAARTGLRVVCHYPDAFGRMLGDLLDADGASASQYMIRDKGWPVWGGAR